MPKGLSCVAGPRLELGTPRFSGEWMTLPEEAAPSGFLDRRTLPQLFPQLVRQAGRRRSPRTTPSIWGSQLRHRARRKWSPPGRWCGRERAQPARGRRPPRGGGRGPPPPLRAGRRAARGPPPAPPPPRPRGTARAQAGRERGRDGAGGRRPPRPPPAPPRLPAGRAGAGGRGGDPVGAHHLVVLVLDDVAVPDVLALLGERHPDPGHLRRVGDDGVLEPFSSVGRRWSVSGSAARSSGRVVGG